MSNKNDELLIESPLSALKQIATSEFSMQVNMDQELGSSPNNSDKKKAKKKEYKRKRKQKIKNQEQQARLKLGQIIREIYEGARQFQTSKNEIKGSLSYLVGGEKFHIFLNEVIKIQVKVQQTIIQGMQGEILEYTQSIIHENSLDKDSNNQQFYLQMVGFIYGLYENLCKSSQQIEKIINLYMCMNANTDQHMQDQYGLDRSTFKFMIDSDDTIKNLLKICRKRISGRYGQQIQQIKELSQMICHEEIQSFCSDDEQFTQKSTSIDEEQQQKEGKKKKKKRKLKESDFSSNIEQVVRRLNEMVIIEEKRGCSGVSQEWVNDLKLRYQYN